MRSTYHNDASICTAFVPSHKRTLASDGFSIGELQRCPNGNVSWTRTQPALAAFLGFPLTENQRVCWRSELEWRGYDPDCLKALRRPHMPSAALSHAAALGFDPIYLWPATASKWPVQYQRIAGDKVAAPSAATAPQRSDSQPLLVRFRAGLMAARKAFLAEVRGGA